MISGQTEHFHQKVEIPKKEWDGFVQFCSQMGEDPYDFCERCIEHHITVKPKYTYMELESGSHVKLTNKPDFRREVSDEDMTKISPDYWKLLRRKILLLLVSTISIVAINMVIRFILSSDSITLSISVGLQVVAMVVCLISLAAISCAADNHTGINRNFAITASRWVEWGMFFTLVLLMVSITLNGILAMINLYL